MNQNIICHFVNGYDKKNPILWQFSNMDTAQSVPSSARADYNIDIYEPAKIQDQLLARCDPKDYQTNFTLSIQPKKKSINIYSQVTETTGAIIDEENPLDTFCSRYYQFDDSKQLFNGDGKKSIIQQSPLKKIQQNPLASKEYNIALVKKIKKQKIKGKNRFSPIFMTRFKAKLKNSLDARLPQNDFQIKELNKIEGMIDPNVGEMLNIINKDNLLDTEVAVREINEEYTSSHEILLDAFFPLKTKSGKYSKTKLEKKSVQDFVRFLSSYEMIPKFMKDEQIPRSTLTFQNLRHYYKVTDKEYSSFSLSD